MKKFLVCFAIFTALIFVVSCGGSKKIYDDSDTGDTATDNDADDTEATDSGDTAAGNEGVYFGIIGFNEAQYTKEIGLLNTSTEESYKSFIDKLTSGDGTALYFADYTALEMMRSYPAPEKLKNVALVTFTDGLDNISLANDDYNPGNYGSTAAYRDALHDMIVKDKIHGLNVAAYTIGLKGKDVTDETAFGETLKQLASSDDNVFQVSDMEEAMEHFKAIAEALYSVSKTVNLDIKVPGGYDDGQHLRFTFDNSDTATDSKLYIEATFHRSEGRTLEDIAYHGLSSQTTVSIGSADGAYYHFVFEDLKYDDGNTPVSDADISRIMLWKETSTGGWDKESEFNPASSSTITEDKNSALIMLVLDCTTSLGSDFARMQQAGKDFVTTLVNGSTNQTEPTDPTDTVPDEDAENTDTDDDSDSENTTNDDDSDSENPENDEDESPLSDEEKCAGAGGTWDPAAQNCYKTKKCDAKPAHSEWNGDSSYDVYYDVEAGAWMPGPAYTTHYGDGESEPCQYKCASNARPDGPEGDECKLLCSAVFDGEKSKIEVAHNDLLNLASETWTIEAWIKQGEDDIPVYVIHPIVRKGITSDPAYVLSGYYKQQSGDGYGMTSYVKYSYGSSTTTNNRLDPTVTHSDDWTHVAMVKNKETSGIIFEETSYKLLLFVNGTQVGSNEFEKTPTVVTNDELLTIGANPVNAERYFKGLIDSIKISNTAKYMENFTPGVLSADNETIAFWDFSGNAEDSSANGLNGTATEVTYSTDCR